MDSFLDSFFETFPVTSLRWEKLLRDFLSVPRNYAHLQNLWQSLEPCLDQLLPSKERVFRAINEVEPDRVKVVIVGQDPYPDSQNACGFCFSVEHGVPPASLKNIFTEIQRDFGGALRTNANLLDWAQQGVLLLNSSLTVLPKQANCHSRIGWNVITEFIAKTVWSNSPDSAFLLWGNNAKKLIGSLKVDESDRIFACGHPSPLAYGRKGKNNFKGCSHFKKVNQFLISRGQLPIVWHERDELLDFVIQ